MPAPRKPKQQKSAIEAPIEIPSILDDQARQEHQDRLIASILAQQEQEEIRLDTLQKLNDHDETDLVPGEDRSYLQGRESIARNRERIAATCNAEQLERVRALAAKR